MIIDGIEYLTTPEAIERLGPDVTADTIRGWVRQGRLVPAGRYPGGAWIFRADDIVEAEWDARINRPRSGRRRSLSANLPKAAQLLLTTAA